MNWKKKDRMKAIEKTKIDEYKSEESPFTKQKWKNLEDNESGWKMKWKKLEELTFSRKKTID